MFWILYFDAECTNKTVGHEAPSLKRVVELNVKYMKVFGNSGENPFQQQLRETHRKPEHLIQKEMRKLGSILK